jgi:hypothetical protein
LIQQRSDHQLEHTLRFGVLDHKIGKDDTTVFIDHKVGRLAPDIICFFRPPVTIPQWSKGKSAGTREK